jgi:hypothetical protein
MALFLRLGDWGRQIAPGHSIREVLALVRAIAKGLIPGVAAAAEGNGGSPCQAESIAVLVLYLKITFHSDRAVIENRYFSRWQGILR